MIGLTQDVVAKFCEEGSWTERAKTLAVIATCYADGVPALAEEERQLAHDLFRTALLDSEPMVRRVLAESVKHACQLPSDIVHALAEDVAEVAAPFLAASPLLGEDELIAIAKAGATAHRDAIARRCGLSGRVADVLFGRPAAVA